MTDFNLVSEITEIEIIAVNKSIRDLARLNRIYGKARWRKLKGVANVELSSGKIRLAEVHWARGARHRQKRDENQTAVFGLIMKAHKFVVCINNKGYEASLEFGKIYQVVIDKDAEAEGLIRIIDESGEDYGYSPERFHVVALPQTLERALLHTV